MANKETLLGVGGTNCSGKDTAANFLATKLNLFNISLADILRIEATKLGVPHDRQNLIEVSKELPKDQSGIGALALRGLEIYEEKNSDGQYSGLLLASIRCTVDAKPIIDRGGTLVFVDAPDYRRYQWSLGRSRDKESQTNYREFKEQSDREYFGVGDPYQPYQSAVKNMSDYTINNESSLQRFRSDLLNVAERIKLST